MSMHWLDWEWPTILCLNLEEDDVCAQPTSVIWVMTKKVFDPDSITNESDMLCEGYGISGGY